MPQILLIVLLLLSACSNNLVVKDNKCRQRQKNGEYEVALVLGAGGARGAAHVGVLQVLEENNIPIDIIIGASAGSIIGALYADSLDARAIEKKVLHLKKWDLIDLSFASALDGIYSLKGGVSGELVSNFINSNIKSKKFEDLKIPFIAVATDVEDGAIIGLRYGNIANAVRASSAIPGMFSPVKIDNRILVDGGVVAPTPVLVAKQLKPKIIIAVDLNNRMEHLNIDNMLGLTIKAMNLTFCALNDLQTKDADILISPVLGNIGFFDDDKNAELIEQGRKATEKQIKIIKKLLKQNNVNI